MEEKRFPHKLLVWNIIDDINKQLIKTTLRGVAEQE